MSTVKADNFTWKSGESGGVTAPTVTGDQVVRGVAKGWFNYNGTTPATRASFNISSMTKNGTGDYTMNFTNSMIDVNYVVIQGAANDGGSDGNRMSRWQTFSQVVGSFRFQINGISTTFSATDATNIHTTIFR